jgi:hypothetical protein
VWTQFSLQRSEEDCPIASHVSAALAVFPTLFQQSPKGRDDLSFVFRFAAWRSGEIAAIDTAGGDISIVPPLGGVPTKIGSVSAAEKLVITPERIPDVLGKLALVCKHGNFSEKQQLAWGYSVRQDCQTPHAKLFTQDDLDF